MRSCSLRCFEVLSSFFFLFAVTKSEEEIREILRRKEARLKEKAERRRKQEQNIAVKMEKRDENK